MRLWSGCTLCSHTHTHTEDPNSNWLNWALFVSVNGGRKGGVINSVSLWPHRTHSLHFYRNVCFLAPSFTFPHALPPHRQSRSWEVMRAAFQCMSKLSSFTPNQYPPSTILYIGTLKYKNFRQSRESWVIRLSILEALLLPAYRNLLDHPGEFTFSWLLTVRCTWAQSSTNFWSHATILSSDFCVCRG